MSKKSLLSHFKQKVALKYSKITYKLEKFGKNLSNIETCVNYYKFFRNTMEENLHIIKNGTIEIKYENFVRNPREELKKLYEFTELSWYDELEKDIPEVLKIDNDEKWKTLPDNEKNVEYKSLI